MNGNQSRLERFLLGAVLFAQIDCEILKTETAVAAVGAEADKSKAAAPFGAAAPPLSPRKS